VQYGDKTLVALSYQQINVSAVLSCQCDFSWKIYKL